jgi:uncharacterized protein YbjT (DUF2867 family)
MDQATAPGGWHRTLAVVPEEIGTTSAGASQITSTTGRPIGTTSVGLCEALRKLLELPVIIGTIDREQKDIKR